MRDYRDTLAAYEKHKEFKRKKAQAIVKRRKKQGSEVEKYQALVREIQQL